MGKLSEIAAEIRRATSELRATVDETIRWLGRRPKSLQWSAVGFSAGAVLAAGCCLYIGASLPATVFLAALVGFGSAALSAIAARDPNEQKRASLAFDLEEELLTLQSQKARLMQEYKDLTKENVHAEMIKETLDSWIAIERRMRELRTGADSTIGNIQDREVEQRNRELEENIAAAAKAERGLQNAPTDLLKDIE